MSDGPLMVLLSVYSLFRWKGREPSCNTLPTCPAPGQARPEARGSSRSAAWGTGTTPHGVCSSRKLLQEAELAGGGPGRVCSATGFQWTCGTWALSSAETAVEAGVTRVVAELGSALISCAVVA